MPAINTGRRTSTRRRRAAGFTLMEVLLVLAILVILGSLAAVSFRGVISDADTKAAKKQNKKAKGKEQNPKSKAWEQGGRECPPSP